MIIVSQEKDHLINFDQIQYVKADRNSIWAFTTNDCVICGSYIDAQKTNQVLSELIEAIENGLWVFNMPE